MKLAPMSLAMVACVLATQARAEAQDPVWTLSADGSWSQIDGSDSDAVSGSVSLIRAMGEASVGASLGTSSGSDALFEATEVTDRTSVFGSVWVAFPVGLLDAEVSATYGQDEYEGEIVVGNAGTVEGASQFDDVSLTAAISRTFVTGNWDVIPSASLGWSQSDATTTVTVGEGAIVPPRLDEEQSGMTASLGLGVGALVNDRLYLFSDIVGLYAENGATLSTNANARLESVRATSRQDEDEATWAEVSVGASLFASDAVTITLIGGTTYGRDEEEVFATTSLSVGF